MYISKVSNEKAACLRTKPRAGVCILNTAHSLLQLFLSMHPIIQYSIYLFLNCFTEGCRSALTAYEVGFVQMWSDGSPA